MDFIPVCTPTLGEEELRNVIDAVKTGWISSKGKYIDEFETKFAKYCNAKHGVTTTNGTTAIHLALLSLGIKNGDEVIIPDFTMVATADAVVYLGAKPVFVDCEPRTYNIDVSKIEEKITEKTKAIIPVDIYGHPVDYDPILKIAKENDLYVVADSAESHGAEYKGKKIGSIADLTCFSFYSNKIVTTGEGGMVLTNSDELAEKAKLLRDLAHSKEKRFLHYEIGYNYRLSNVLAAIGVAQLEKIDKFVEMRRNNAKLYNSLLKDVKGIVTPKEEKWAKNVYWMYGILAENEFGIKRDALMKMLAEKGIETRTFFISMHQQPVFKNLDSSKGKFPVSDHIAETGFYLPSSSHLKKEQIEFICETIRDLHEKRK